MNLFETDGQPVTVTAAELANWLGVTTQSIYKSKAAGRLKAEPDGRFNLQASVRTIYHASLRRREHGELRGDQEQQIKYWQVENLKEKNASWRRMYGEQLIHAYIQHHKDALDVFRNAIAKYTAAVQAGMALADMARMKLADDVPTLDAADNEEQDTGAAVAE